MNAAHESHHHERTSSRIHWVLIGFLVIAGFFLFTEHRAHLFGIIPYLPYLLLLGCLLMHLFMHGDHSHGGGGSPSGGAAANDHPSKGDRP